jgi:hypothetical protein
MAFSALIHRYPFILDGSSSDRQGRLYGVLHRALDDGRSRKTNIIFRGNGKNWKNNYRHAGIVGGRRTPLFCSRAKNKQPPVPAPAIPQSPTDVPEATFGKMAST